MTIDELIKELERIKLKHGGNVEVFMADSGKVEEVGFSTNSVVMVILS